MRKPAILCVDPDSSGLERLKIELQAALGDRALVATAQSGLEALERLKKLQQTCDLALVIADARLPNLSGDELLCQVHTLSPHTLTILISGQADLQVVSRALEGAGLYRLIVKPWHPQDLSKTVGAAIEQYLRDRQRADQTATLQQRLRELETQNQTLQAALQTQIGGAGYRLLFDSNPNPMWIYDLETLAFLAVNNAAIQHYGYSRDEFLGMTIADIRPPEDIPALLANIKAVTEGLDQAGRWRHLKKDGSVIQVEITSHTLTFAGRRAEAVLSKDVTETMRLATERQEREILLHQKEETLRKLSEQLPGVIYQYRLYPDGRSCFPYASEAIREIYAVSPTQVQESAAAVFAILHPEDLERISDSIYTSARTLQLWHEQYRVILADKGLRWLEGHAIPERLADGSTLWHGYIWDISDRVAIQARLQEQEIAFRSLVENSPDIIERFDLQFRHLYVSPALTNLTGIPASEFIGKTCRELALPEDMVNLWEIAAQTLLATGDKQVIEFELQAADGHHWYEALLAPEFSDSGEIESFLSISREITDRKRLEIALQKSEQRFQLAATAVNGYIYDWDVQQNQVYRTPRFFELLGYSLDQVEETSDWWFERIHPEDLPQIISQWQAVLTNTNQHRFCAEYRVRHCDQHYLYIYDCEVILRDQTGQVIRVVGYAFDISDRKQLELNLRQYERIVSATPDCVSLLDRTYTYRLINQSHADWTEKSQEEIVGHRFSELLGEEFFQTVAKPSLDRCLAGEGEQRIEAWMDRPDGERRFLQATYTPYIEPDGTISGVVINVHDLTDLKRSEQALAVSEARFRELAEAITDVFYVFDAASSNVLYVSPAYETVWGHSCASLYQDSTAWLAAIHPDDFEQVLAAFQTQFHGQAAELEYRIIRPDGSIRWIQDCYFPILNPAGQMIRLDGVAKDITDRKQNEIALAESEERFRLAVDAAHMGTWDWNIVTNEVIWSEGMERLMGMTPGTFDRRLQTVIEMIHPEDLSRVQAAIQNSIEQDAVYEIEFRFVKPDGNVRWCVSRGNVVRNQQGQAIRMLGVDVDITDRKRLELEREAAAAALWESQEFVQRIVDSSPNLIYIYDLIHQRNVYINREIYDYLGYTAEESQVVFSQGFSDVVHPEDLPHIYAHFEHLSQLPYQVTGAIEYRMRHKNGEWRWFSSRDTVFKRDEQGNVTQIVGSALDITKRKLAEIALIASEANLKEAQRIAHLGNWKFDLLNHRLSWSTEVFRIFGLAGPTEPTLEEKIQFYHPDDRPILSQHLQHTIATGEPFEFDGLRLIRPDGQLRYLQVRGEAQRNEQGEVTLLFGTIQDITDRKVTEIALIESHQRLAMILENSPLPIFIKDLEGRYIACNPAYEQLTHLNREQLLSSSDHDFLPRDFAVICHLSDQLAATSNQPITFEEAVPFADGAHTLVITKFPLTDSQGESYAVCGILLDITERKRMEIALRESEQQYRRIVETAAEGIWIVDTDGNTSFVNPRMADLLGYSIAEMLAQPLFAFMDEEDRAIAAALLERRHQEISEQHDFKFRCKDGSTLWTLVSTNPILDQNGNYLGCLGMLTDISDRKAAELTLQRRAEQEALIRVMTDRIRQSLDLDVILNTTVSEVRQWLRNDRVIIYRFHPDWSGTVITEAVSDPQFAILGQFINDHCFGANHAVAYQAGKISLFHDLEQAQIQPCHRDLLRSFNVRANLVVPILHQQHLWGLLIAQHCRGPRSWSTEEVELLQQLASQAGIAIARAELVENLRESEEQRRLALEFGQIGSWDWNLLTQSLDWNTWHFTLLGYSPDQVEPSYQTWFDRVHPDDLQRIEQAIHHALTTQTDYDQEYRILLPSGQIRWVLGKGRAIYNPEGQPERMLGILLDISERKSAEIVLQRVNQELEERVQRRTLALRQSEEMFRQMAENINEILYVDSADRQRTLYISPAYETVWGRNPEELYQHSQSWLESIHPEDRERVTANYYCKADAYNFTEEYRILRPDGTVRWIFDRISPIWSETRQILCHVGIAEDITDRKLAELSLQQEAEKERILRLITQQIHQSLELDQILARTVSEVRSSLNADRVAVYHFDSDWSGRFIAESVAEGWVKLVDGQTKTIWEDSYLQETQGGRYGRNEISVVPDVDTTPYSPCHLDILNQFQVKAFLIVPIFVSEKLWGLLAAYQNSGPRQWETQEVTLLQNISLSVALAIQQANLYTQVQTELDERRQTEVKLQTSLQEKELLLKEIHHRVKNNLQMVASLLMLQADTTDDPRMLKLIQDSEERIAAIALVHEYLYQSPNLARIAFNDYIQDLVEQIFTSYANPHLELNLSLTPIEINIETALPCGLILNELVTNVLKYAFPNGRSGWLEIGLEQQGEMFCLSIADSGVGFPPQLNWQQSPSLGFQLVRDLVRQLQGTIDISSVCTKPDHEPAGTVVTIVFRELNYRQRL